MFTKNCANKRLFSNKKETFKNIIFLLFSFWEADGGKEVSKTALAQENVPAADFLCFFVFELRSQAHCAGGMLCRLQCGLNQFYCHDSCKKIICFDLIWKGRFSLHSPLQWHEGIPFSKRPYLIMLAVNTFLSVQCLFWLFMTLRSNQSQVPMDNNCKSTCQWRCHPASCCHCFATVHFTSHSLCNATNKVFWCFRSDFSNKQKNGKQTHRNTSHLLS